MYCSPGMCHILCTILSACFNDLRERKKDLRRKTCAGKPATVAAMPSTTGRWAGVRRPTQVAFESGVSFQLAVPSQETALIASWKLTSLLLSDASGVPILRRATVATAWSPPSQHSARLGFGAVTVTAIVLPHEIDASREAVAGNQVWMCRMPTRLHRRPAISVGEVANCCQLRFMVNMVGRLVSRSYDASDQMVS